MFILSISHSFLCFYCYIHKTSAPTVGIWIGSIYLSTLLGAQLKHFPISQPSLQLWMTLSHWVELPEKLQGVLFNFCFFYLELWWAEFWKHFTMLRVTQTERRRWCRQKEGSWVPVCVCVFFFPMQYWWSNLGPSCKLVKPATTELHPQFLMTYFKWDHIPSLSLCTAHNFFYNNIVFYYLIKILD